MWLDSGNGYIMDVCFLSFFFGSNAIFVDDDDNDQTSFQNRKLHMILQIKQMVKLEERKKSQQT